MANPILHIKDSYYFEVPKVLWAAEYSGIKEEDAFPAWLIRLDQDYLDWQAKRFVAELGEHPEMGLDLPPVEQLMAEYHRWIHADHDNVGRSIASYLQGSGQAGKLEESASFRRKWDSILAKVGDVREYRASSAEWGVDKVDGYNQALSGKILIPQPFGTLNNLYSAASGFCISKFMVIQVVVAILVAWLFVNLSRRIRSSGGDATKGRLANALEAMLIFMRDEVARPAIGHDADKFVPLLWSIFFFVLGLNLMGMLPWMGAPTGAFGCTLGLAGVTLLTGVVMGSRKFGLVGFWVNQVPSMDLPKALNLPIKGLLFVIEVLGLFIKHSVLAIRLLANMFAGHIVLLGIMGIAFSVQGAMSSGWWVAAPISVIGATLFSVLELFVAFLQAYVFTFLSALFIGAATHHH